MLQKKNWLYLGKAELLLTQNSANSYSVFNISSYKYVSSSSIDGTYSVRPVFYLTEDTQFVDGDGSKKNPYQLIKS